VGAVKVALPLLALALSKHGNEIAGHIMQLHERLQFILNVSFGHTCHSDGIDRLAEDK
jgi:hypothetical protein